MPPGRLIQAQARSQGNAITSAMLVAPSASIATRSKPMATPAQAGFAGMPEWVRALAWALLILAGSAVLGWTLTQVVHHPRQGVTTEASPR